MNGMQSSYQIEVDMIHNWFTNQHNLSKLGGLVSRFVPLTDVDDVVQIAHYHAWRWVSAHGLPQNAQLSTWLYKVVVNAAIDEKRKRRRFNIQIPRENLNGINTYKSQVVLQPERLYSSAEILGLVLTEMRELPRHERETLIYVANGTPYKEISELLGIQVPTVKTRVHRARESLTTTMQQKYGLENLM